MWSLMWPLGLFAIYAPKQAAITFISTMLQIITCASLQALRGVNLVHLSDTTKQTEMQLERQENAADITMEDVADIKTVRCYRW